MTLSLMRIFLLALFLIVLSSQILWDAHPNLEQSNDSTTGHIFDFDLDRFRSEHLPSETLSITLPIGANQYEHFELKAYRMMEEGLKDRYPEIQTFKGYSTKGTAVYLSTSPYGIHALIQRKDGPITIDPIPGSSGQHQMIFEKEMTNLIDPHICATIGSRAHMAERAQLRDDAFFLHTYRLSVSTTGEFSIAHGGTLSSVMAEVVAIVNRVNAVYERDFAIRLILVENTDQLFFFDPSTDPFTNGSPGALQQENNVLTFESLGFDQFDIGHVFGTNAGGVASIRAVCGGLKAAASSSTFGNYSGALFYHIVAHEMGHQFGANHTFNLCDGFNEFGLTGYEPGSGSTLMSYAGASNCGPNYVKGTSDAYFHAVSIQEVIDYSRSGSGDNCAQKVEIANDAPEITDVTPSGLTLPISTPFYLYGAAEDPDGDDLTYTWEQFDLGPQSMLGEPEGNAPRFRSYFPSSDGLRTLPKLINLIHNLPDDNEVLPDATMPLNFRLTVRDNNPVGGRTISHHLSLAVNENAGPFEVAFPNGREAIETGSFVEVQWSPAQTDIAPVNCSHVRILMSRDGGFTYPDTLSQSTINDGSEIVQMPDSPVSNARLRIEGENHIFFDISDANFELIDPAEPVVSFFVVPDTIPLCAPGSSSARIFLSAGGSTDTMFFELTGLPPGISYTFSENPVVGSNEIIIHFETAPATEINTFDVQVVLERPLDTLVEMIVISTQEFISRSISLEYPPSGVIVGQSQPTLTWELDKAYPRYVVEVNESPAFQTSTSSIRAIVEDTFYIPSFPLLSNTLYYWRVTGLNTCGEGEHSEVRTFVSKAESCQQFVSEDTPVNIPFGGNLTAESIIQIDVDATINDLNILQIKGERQFVGDLDVILQSPNGTVTLFANKCANQSNFDLGFDDESDLEITCPLTDQMLHKPEMPLESITDGSSLGSWTLQVRDRVGGVGGTLETWTLEVCTDLLPEGPSLIVNEVLSLQSKSTKDIDMDHLLSEDEEFNSGEVKYTLVSAPDGGILVLDNMEISEGATFSQNDIDAGLLSYSHQDTAFNRDSFKFTVVNPAGGFLDISTFRIEIEDAVSSQKIQTSGLPFVTRPNPFNQSITVEFHQPIDRGTWSVHGLAGQLVGEGSFENSPRELRLDLSQLAGGMYLLSIQSAKKVYVTKILKSR